MTDSQPSADPPEVRETVASQASWAVGRGLALNPNRTGFREPIAGLFREMSPETRGELELGAGGELSRIHSLRSSTCLAINVFEPWRPSPKILGDLFGTKANSLFFEAKQSTGLKGEPPHLDVLLTGPRTSVGIEAKFLELYCPAKNSFSDSYFPTEELGSPLWKDLEECRRLAESIRDGTEVFTWLAAGQLLKHALGLSKNQPQGFRLVLVWYRIEGPTANAIETEIGRFARATSSELDFTAVTYQDLVSRLAADHREPIPDYFGYLADRYQLYPEQRRQLPLITLAQAPAVNQKSDFTNTIATLDATRIVEAYYQTVARAPQRPLQSKRFLVDNHDGAGGHADRSYEKKAAKALFNRHRPLVIGDRRVSIIDYEVPLRSRQADREVGEVDLLGLDPTSSTVWGIELKVSPNTDTPLKALYQGLRYNAILDANRRHLNTEIESRTALAHVVWSGVISVAADSAYWNQWNDNKTSDWFQALKALAAQIANRLQIEIVFLDLGTLGVDVIDGVAQLTSELEIRLL